MARSRVVGFGMIVAAVALLSTACIVQGSWTAAIAGSPPQAVEPGVLNQVDCATTSWCLSAGGGSTTGAAGEWNGSAWHPAPRPPAAITDLDCAAVDDCWAIGADRLHHFDGAGWTTPPWPAGTTAHALSCPTTGWCALAATVGSTSAVLGWNGTTTSNLAAPSAFIGDVACPATNRCMAVGSSGAVGFAALWTGGTSWTTSAVPAGFSYLATVGCSSTTSCAAGPGEFGGPSNVVWQAVGGWTLATGASENIACAPGICLGTGTWTDEFGLYGGSSVARVSGATVSPFTTYGEVITDLACTGPTDCVAVNGVETVRRWNGAAWTTDVTDLRNRHTETAASIGCDPSGVCLATSASAGDEPLLIRTDGATASPVDVGPGPGADSFSGSAVSCPQVGWCVGVFAVSVWDPYVGFVAHHLDLVSGTDGAWTTERAAAYVPSSWGSSPTVDCASSSSCLAVHGNLPLRWDGSGWTQLASLGSVPERVDVDCTASTSCVLVTDSSTDNGAFRRFDGTAFGSPIPVPSGPGGGPVDLESVSCLPDGSCLAVGRAHDGTNWVPWAVRLAPDGTVATTAVPDFVHGPADLRDLSCTAAGECLAIGEATVGGARQPVAIAWLGSWLWVGQALPTLADGTTSWDHVSCTGRQCTIAGTTTLTAGGTRLDVARFAWPA